MTELSGSLRALAETHDRMVAHYSYGSDDVEAPMVNIRGEPLKPPQVAAVLKSRESRTYHRKVACDLREAADIIDLVAL